MVGSSSSRTSGRLQQQRGQPQQDRLAAGDFADGAVEVDVAEPEFAEGGQGAFLDVPVVADCLEMPLGHVTGLDGVQSGPLCGDAERRVDFQGRVEGDALREVSDLAGDAHRAVGGGEFPGDQLQQGRFAGAVDPDESGPAGAERDVEPVEDGGAVRPGEREGGTGDGLSQNGPRGCVCGQGRHMSRHRKAATTVSGGEREGMGKVLLRKDGSKAEVARDAHTPGVWRGVS